MNRAILIVICDFLVSAMLSMMTGMVPAHTGGTAAGLDEQTTRALLAEMHENMSQLERTRELLRETIRRNGGATPEQIRQLHELARQIVALQRDTEMLKSAAEKRKLANLTAKELQRRLEAELRERRVAEMELKERSRDLAQREQDLRSLRDNSQGTLASQMRINEDLSRTNAALAAQNAETSRKLAETDRELRSTEKALDKETGRRELAEERLKDTRSDLARTRSERDRTLSDLRTVGAQNTKNKAEAEKQRALYTRTRQELHKREQELARKQDETNRLEREKKQAEVENARLKKDVEEQQRVVKNSLKEVRDTRKKLEETEIELAKAKAEVKEKTETIKAQKEATKVANTQLQIANKKLGNQVLKSYADGVVRLTVDIREERMMGREIRAGGTFYLPLVKIGDKTFLVGHVNQFIGDDGNSSLRYQNVKTAVLFAAPPSVKRDAVVKTPVMLANAEPLLAAIPMTMKTRKPLQALTVSELRDYGVDGLFLFKAGSPGNQYAELNGRCSIGLDGELFVRNSGSRSELRAEPGDMILTRSGEFVGIVAAADASGSSRRGDQARVFVMPDVNVWNDAKLTISYTRPEGKKYFTDFEESVRKFRNAPPTVPSRRRRHH